jgi:hypothetical protein
MDSDDDISDEESTAPAGSSGFSIFTSKGLKEVSEEIFTDVRGRLPGIEADSESDSDGDDAAPIFSSRRDPEPESDELSRLSRWRIGWQPRPPMRLRWHATCRKCAGQCTVRRAQPHAPPGVARARTGADAVAVAV